MTPFESIIEDLWNAPQVRLRGKEYFVQFMAGLASMYGLTDALTPGCIVYRHNDPDCPGELRVKLASQSVVLCHYFFREAPAVKVELTIPIDKYKEGMERGIDPQQVITRLVQMLLSRGAERQEPTAPKPKLMLPEEES